MAKLKYKENNQWKEIDASDLSYEGGGRQTVKDAVMQRDRVWNLLDNSDFRNPVNQRGKTSYTAAGYTIDRWRLGTAAKLEHGSGQITLDNTAGTKNVNFEQLCELSKFTVGKTYTVALERANGTINAESFVLTTDGVSVLGVQEFYVHIACTEYAVYVQVRMRSGYSDGFKWIALYEGSYTAETLPPYLPKGYAAELAECQRYYRKSMATGTFGTLYDTTKSIIALCFPRTRLVPPTITIVSVGSQGWGDITPADLQPGWTGVDQTTFYINYTSESKHVGKTVTIDYEASADL